MTIARSDLVPTRDGPTGSRTQRWLIPSPSSRVRAVGLALFHDCRKQLPVTLFEGSRGCLALSTFADSPVMALFRHPYGINPISIYYGIPTGLMQTCFTILFDQV